MRTQKLLFVDDDPNILDAFRRNLRKTFTFDTAENGHDALKLIATDGPYALVLSDMRMPGMDGVELLEKVHQASPDTVRMMLTGNADQQTAIDAVNRGQIFRFLNKPCPPEILIPALQNGLKQYDLLHVERDLLEGTLIQSVKTMSEVLGMVAPEALGRGQRLRDSMRQFARWLKIGPLWELEIAALLSPIGYASIPPIILRKLAALDTLFHYEQTIIDRVPEIGYELLRSIPRLHNVALIIRHQRQNFDGTGHPTANPLAGDKIPIGARILRILQDRATLEADGIVKKNAINQMNARTGHYDPALLQNSFACFEGYLVSTLAKDKPVHSLKVSQLIPGHIVVSDIITRQGLLLVSGNNALSEMMLERLRNYSLLEDIKEPILVQEPDPTPPAAA